MDHIAAERFHELVAPSVEDDIETNWMLSPEESAHLQECPSCIDLFAEIVREGVRRPRKSETPTGRI